MKDGKAIVQHVMHTLKSFYYNTEVEVAIWSCAEEKVYTYPQDAILSKRYSDITSGFNESIHWASVTEEQTFSKVIDENYHFYIAPIRFEGVLSGMMIAGPVIHARDYHASHSVFLKHAVLKLPPRHQYLCQLMHHLMKTSLYIGPHEALTSRTTYMTQKDMAMEVEYAMLVSKVNLIVEKTIDQNKSEALSIYKKSLLVGDFTDHESENAIMIIKQTLMTIEALLSHRFIHMGYEPWLVSGLKNTFYNQILTNDNLDALIYLGEEMIASYCHLEKPLATTSYTECVSSAFHFIQTHFKKRIGTEDVCQSANVSKSTLSAYFQRELGMSIGNCINVTRVNYAKHKLQNSSDSISAIAIDSGFDNQNYFTTVFKRVVGVTPNQYRMRD